MANTNAPDSNEYGSAFYTDFAETPEFTLDELLTMVRRASARYASGEIGTIDGAIIRARAALDIETLTQRIRQDYPEAR